MLLEKKLPIRACAVCGGLTSDESSILVSKTSSVFSSVRDECGNLMIDECGSVGSDYRVCEKCHSSLNSGRLPKLAIVNGFDLGCNQQMSAYLKNLTEVEEMLIAKSRPFGKV